MRSPLQSLLVSVMCLVTPARAASYDDRYSGMGYDDRPMNEDEFFGRRMQEHQAGHGLYQQPQRRGGYNLVMAALVGVGLEWFWTGRTIRNERKEHDEKAEEFRRRWTREFDALKTKRATQLKILMNSLEEADFALLQLVAAANDAGVEVHNAFVGGSGSGLTVGAGASANTGSRLGGGYSTGFDTINYDAMDYEEFRQPDANGDHVISRMEFNYFIRQYIAANPDINPAGIPRFEDFDLDGDGFVTFEEWQHYLDRQPDGYNSLPQNLHQNFQQRAQGRAARM